MSIRKTNGNNEGESIKLLKRVILNQTSIGHENEEEGIKL